MKFGIKPAESLLSRADVKFHLGDKHKFSFSSVTIGELKELIVRDPMCYGFQYCTEGIPMIRIGDFEEPFINFSRVANVSDETHNRFSKTHLEPFDILMSVRGVSIGRIAVFMGETPKANICPNVIIIRLKDKTLVPYVASVLISDIGQNQIKMITAGSSKPTITSSMISSIEIPFPDDEVVKEITELFNTMYAARSGKDSLRNEVEELIKEALNYKEVKNKKCTYLKDLSKEARWDPHFHQECYKDISDYIQEFGGDTLGSIVESITDTINQKSINEKIRYIEISDINNIDASISSEAQIDYVKKLPSGGKIQLKDNDILLSKVRPYRKGFSIFVEKDSVLTTATKNGLAVFRTTSYEYPYYLLAILRSPYGLPQIVRRESGTSYPTVDENDISKVIIPNIGDEIQTKINKLYREYIASKDIEKDCMESINDLLDTL